MIFAEVTETIIGAGAGLTLGGLVSALVTYFTVTSKARQFVRDTMGEHEQSTVTIKNQPLEVKRMSVYAEKDATDGQFSAMRTELDGVRRHFDERFDQVRRETDVKLDKMTTDAVVGRRNMHDKIERLKDELSEVKQDVARVPEQTINLLLKTKELRS